MQSWPGHTNCSPTVSPSKRDRLGETPRALAGLREGRRHCRRDSLTLISPESE